MYYRFLFFRAYSNNCLKAVAKFSAEDLIKNDQPEIMKRIKTLITTLQVIYEYNENDLRRDLSGAIENWMRQKFQLKEFLTIKEQAQSILDMLSEYGILTLGVIAKKFHNFATETWCPIFAKSLLKILLPLMKDFMVYEPEDMELHILTYNLLLHCREAQKYLDDEKAFTTKEITQLFRYSDILDYIAN